MRKYVPELPDYGTPITINHLLWHTSGLRDYVALLLLGGYDYPDVTTEAQALEFISWQQKLNFTPGSSYEYSNSGYFLLSLIVKRVTGKSQDAFAREQIFNPLGMPHATFRDRHDKPIPNVALGYEPTNSGRYVVGMSNWEQVGDGALHLSINEMQKWDENFYTVAVGGRAFLTEMHHTGTLSNGRSLIYARGIQVDNYRGLRRVRHGGDWVGYHSNLVRFPDVHTTVALMCNSEVIDQYTLSSQVIDIALENVFSQPKPVEPQPAPSLPLDQFVGTYFNSTKNEVYAVSADHGTLTLNYMYLALPLISTGPTTFTIAGLPGSVVEFAVQGNESAQSLKFTLVSDEPDDEPRQGSRFTPISSPDVNAYAGTFHSPELGVTWQLVVDEGKLRLKKDREQIVIPMHGPLKPAMQDTFYGNAGYLHFTRDASGRVNGFKMSFIRMTDFQFNLVGPAPLDAGDTQQDEEIKITDPAARVLLKTTTRAVR